MKKIIFAMGLALCLVACASVPDLTRAEKAEESGDYATALKNWEALAAYGYPEAQLGLAGLYEKGNGVEKDMNKAEKYYLEAAAQKYPRALVNTGRFYERRKQKDLALKYYREAAALGVTSAEKRIEKLETGN